MRIRSTVAAEQTARLDHGCSWKGWLPEVSWMRHVCWNHGQWRRNEPLHWRTHPQGLCWWPVWSMSTGWVCVKIIESMLAPFSSKCSYIPVILPHFPYRINISSSSNLKKKNKTKQDISSPAKFNASTSCMAPVYRTDSRFLTSTIAKGIAHDFCFQHDMFGTQRWRASLETLHVGLHDQNVMFPL